MRSLTVALGLILSVGGGADFLLHSRYATDWQMETQFCRFGLCDNRRWVAGASRELWQTSSPQLPQVIGAFRLVLGRDPNSPFNWVNLGDALAAAQLNQYSDYCFRQAIALAPHWPPIQMRAANSYFRSGDIKVALPLTAEILDRVEQYDDEIFAHYAESQKVNDILDKGFSRDPRPVRAFLQYLSRTGKLDEALQVWNWITIRGLADQRAVNEYVAFLLTKNHPEDAVSAWKNYLGPGGTGYAGPNYVFNGEFEAGFTGNPLDWNVQHVEGVEATRDANHPASGKWSLRVQFDGKHNVTDTGVRQAIVLRPGAYRLHALVRSEGLTTDQGIQIRISSLNPGSSWSSTSDPLLGTRPWSLAEIRFTVPQNSSLYGIQLVRNQSLKFDNRIAGVLWIDDVWIERLP